MTRAQQGGGGVLKTRGRYGAQRGHPWGMRNGEGGGAVGCWGARWVPHLPGPRR